MEDTTKPDQLSSLDKFKRRLERRGGESSQFKSTLLPTKNYKTNKAWGDDDFTSVDYRPAVAKKTNLFLWRLFWGSTIFFSATLAVAVYVLFFSANIVSGNNIDLLIKGPSQIRSGDELNLQTTISNKNKVTLNSVNLVFSYPPGTMDPLSPNKELPIWREKINDLGPGQSVDVSSRAVIFGGQNSNREIKVVLEYRIPDSNALFTKEKIYSVTIGSSSLDLGLQLPTEINIGKEFTGKLKVVSNAQSLLRNCTINFEWPVGFEFKDSDPPVVSGNNVWFLGDLIPGTEKEISFTGLLKGQSGDVKPFKVIAGFASGGGQDPITLEYGNIFQTINLRKDLVSADIFLADESGRDQVIFPGGSLTGDIGWVNNLNDEIINASFQLKLEGALINKRTVKAPSGFYNSINNTISWDERSLKALKKIIPSDGGQTSFSFGLLPLAYKTDRQGEELKLSLIFTGTRLTGENQTEEVVTQSEKTIRVSTFAELENRTIYSVGPFKNVGPLPPKVGQETTYTVTWAVKNTINDLGNVKVRTVLPSPIKWLGSISPLDEKVVYNQTSGEVVWDLGTVEAGTGDSLPTRQLYFQVSLLPSLSQVGNPVNLTREVTLTGKDLFTGVEISRSVSAGTTNLSADPVFDFGDEEVTE
jgi:hypothetical protein